MPLTHFGNVSTGQLCNYDVIEMGRQFSTSQHGALVCENKNGPKREISFELFKVFSLWEGLVVLRRTRVLFRCRVEITSSLSLWLSSLFWVFLLVSRPLLLLLPLWPSSSPWVSLVSQPSSFFSVSLLSSSSADPT